MKTVHGQLHRITDLKGFVASWLGTGGKPVKGHVPWGTARLHLATDFPGGQFHGGFVPPMSLKTDADSQGRFSFSVPDAFANSRGQLLAFNVTMVPSPLPGSPPLPMLETVYRSAPFKVSAVPSATAASLRHVYVFPSKTPDELGISQAALDKQLTTLRQSLKLDKLVATIKTSRVAVRAEKSGGVVTFSAFVRGSTSDDLGRVIEVKAGEIDIDLPGPDFIVGLCVDEDAIEASIRSGLSKMSKKISADLLAELDKQAPGIGGVATASVWRTRFVQTGTKKIVVPGLPPVQIPLFAAVPDAAFGVPRNLY
jgi:hypothetical protein